MQSFARITKPLPAFVTMMENIQLQFPKITSRKLNIFDILWTHPTDLDTGNGPYWEMPIQELNEQKGIIMQAIIHLAMVWEQAPEEPLNWFHLRDQDLGRGMKITIIKGDDNIGLEAPPRYSHESLAQHLTSRYVLEENGLYHFRREWIFRFKHSEATLITE